MADETDKRFSEVVDLLKANPHMGVRTDRPDERRLALARLPFIIIYATAPGKVYILRLLHSARTLVGE